MSSKTRKEPDTNEDGPAKKKTKPSSSPTKQQSSLLQFFGKPKPNNDGANITNKVKASKHEPLKLNGVKEEKKQDEKPQATKTNDVPKTYANAAKDNATNKDTVPAPVIPKQVPHNPKAKWKIVNNCMMVRCIKEEPRDKAAAFDVDGTLLVWRIAGWPSKFEHYELWYAGLFAKLQQLHDDGYKLVLFSNQGAIRSAFEGKKATFVKSLFEWISHEIQRPVHIVLSTNKKLGFHKPNPGMWEMCEKHCNGGVAMDVNQSFFVGDSVGDDDPQGGVDEKFAKNIGALKGGTLKFYTPDAYFGPSDSDKRKKQGALSDYDGPPLASLEARKALLGGYLKGPIVLLLSGVQGSGKSTFCRQLIPDSDDAAWIGVSQDTINKGKPGKREAVEAATRLAIQKGQSVVVDRTHLEPGQRKHFVDIAKELNVPVHVIAFQPSKDVIAKRVRERTNHPGGVEGEKGVRVAMMHMAKMVLPNYKDEGFDLISCVHREDAVKRLSNLYGQVIHDGKAATAKASLPRKVKFVCGTTMPILALGTMKVGKRIGQDVVSTALKTGWKAVDTAPTYNNEDVVGKGLAADKDAFVIGKVPKRVSQPGQVREELQASLDKLNRRKVDLLLLHWPCDVIEAGTLKTVWEAMEKCVADGKCRALGVCNFSVDALRQLLPQCSIPPAVNQVERHPLLPQMDLLDFCSNQGIVLQAHTPLGQGKLLANETIVNIAKKANRTPVQTVLMWNLRHGVSVVPKCASKDHQKEILDIFRKKMAPLDSEEMKLLDEMKEKQRFVSPPFMKAPGKVYSWKR